LGEIHLRSEGEKDPAVESPATNEMEPDAPIATAYPAEQAFNADLLMQDKPSAPTSSYKFEDSSPEDAPPVLLHKPDASSAKDAAPVLLHKVEHSSAGDAAPGVPSKLENSSAMQSSQDVVAKERLERRTRVEFTARQELMEKLERVRAIASHRLPSRPSIEQLVDFMADYVIHREDPRKRHERRQARQMRRGKAPD
jgi:hypothetical protein